MLNLKKLRFESRVKISTRWKAASRPRDSARRYGDKIRRPTFLSRGCAPKWNFHALHSGGIPKRYFSSRTLNKVVTSRNYREYAKCVGGVALLLLIRSLSSSSCPSTCVDSSTNSGVDFAVECTSWPVLARKWVTHEFGNDRASDLALHFKSEINFANVHAFHAAESRCNVCFSMIAVHDDQKRPDDYREVTLVWFLRR